MAKKGDSFVYSTPQSSMGTFLHIYGHTDSIFSFLFEEREIGDCYLEGARGRMEVAGIARDIMCALHTQFSSYIRKSAPMNRNFHRSEAFKISSVLEYTSCRLSPLKLFHSGLLCEYWYHRAPLYLKFS